MAPTASTLKDAIINIYTRSADSLIGTPIDAAMAQSLEKRNPYANPKDFSKGIIAIFAILGGTMAFSVWWFFLKKGGFQWREDDWDDYKSSVMRRKGPDGKTISSGSTRAPDTVVTDLTYQTEGTSDYAQTEKQSQAGRSGRSGRRGNDRGGDRGVGGGEAPKAKWAKKPERSNSKRSIFSRWGRKRDNSPTSTNRDPDLESYADEEPARMKSYNPHPVPPPSTIAESDISEARLDQRGTGFSTKNVGRNPSRYAYAYAPTEGSDKSKPMGPRQSTKKSRRAESSSSSRSAAPKRKSTHRAAAHPDLSTIPDETEGSRRMSFEASDDAAFTVYSEPISRPSPAVTSPPKKTAATSGSKGTKTYSYPMGRDPTKRGSTSRRNHQKSQYSSSSRTGRKESAGTYRTASTDSSDSECPSDCSCCTTDSDSDSDNETDLSQQFRESARGDLGTKVYHHPLGLGINPKRISSPVPTGQIVMGKQRGKQPQPVADRRAVAARSYRQESRGSLSSDSEGDSGNETVTSRVTKALNGKR
ncbi:hypothetical protein TWF225_003331 [Orbilia oligospora]|uniref:Uncharacterized protein n=1 Tax=Orbilia oligospora TaxID=2813651 RepID=A0A7C8K2V2_ORBOL|nr:hypothetical protein TWF751_005063 [Orbilia oligospora]KAF3160691.1 hypothetical protein TWF225_003331 [Orbilia oligospora]KAF3253692.1 hypothetical protein TWF217_007470 [Orbilia oligospora]KAF3258724.1 hypothetical protein TWF128_004530 [Orbilia oligospora]KAF3296441.1 hypothetical protein TWF132_011031 [Orbilia oligospora]